MSYFVLCTYIYATVARATDEGGIYIYIYICTLALRLQVGVGRVRGGGREAGVRRAGENGGGAENRAEECVQPADNRRRQRSGFPGEPLPAVPPAQRLRRLQPHRLRRAHRPPDPLAAAVQQHRGPPDRARGRPLGRRPLRPRLLLHQCWRLAAGTYTIPNFKKIFSRNNV